jgi:hypothetical protein
MTEFISPIEVFEAELGDPAPLSALLRSDKSLDKRTRVAIAMLIEGRLDRHKKGRGRPNKFQNWEQYARSPYKRAARYVEFQVYSDDQEVNAHDKIKGLSHEKAAERALAENHLYGGMRATKKQIMQYLGKMESQRPKPPELSSIEDYILHEFDEYRRKIPTK